METVLQKLINRLICFHCYCQLEPPLFRCPGYNYFCKGCRKISACITKNTYRDYVLENLSFSTILQCSFASSGCTFTGTGIIVASHEKFCPYIKKRLLTDDCMENEEQSESIEQNRESVGTNPGISGKFKNANKAGLSIDEAILAELECPVCRLRISPPISECVNGHRVCVRCSSLINNCAVCRGPKSASTHVILEWIFHMLEMPCINAENGCSYYGKAPAVLIHEKLCGPGFCPLKTEGMCSWQGMKSEIVNHCKMVHSDVLSLKPHQLFVEHLSKNPSTYYFYINGILLRCGWQSDENIFQFHMKYRGLNCSGETYLHEFLVIKPEPRSVALFKGLRCRHVINFEMLFNENKCFDVHVRCISQYLEGDEVKFVVENCENEHK